VRRAAVLIAALALAGLGSTAPAAAPRGKFIADAGLAGKTPVLRLQVGNRESPEGSSGTIRRITLYRPPGAVTKPPARGRLLGQLRFYTDRPDRAVQHAIPLRRLRPYRLIRRAALRRAGLCRH
jgi:hypothetical protein